MKFIVKKKIIIRKNEYLLINLYIIIFKIINYKYFIKKIYE